MNAIELYHQDGRTAGIFYCAKCRVVAKTKEAADSCCVPRKCSECGVEVLRYALQCDACYPKVRDREDAERRAKRLASAEIVEGYAGAVYWDGAPGEACRASSFFIGDNDGFFFDMNDLLAAAEESAVELPEFVFCCNERAFHLDIDSAIENDCTDLYEDAQDALEGEDELRAAVDAFNERNKGVLTYNPDFSRMVRVPRIPSAEASKCGGIL